MSSNLPPPPELEAYLERRSELAAPAIRAFIDAGAGSVHDIETTVTDLIGDLLHFLNREGHNPDLVIATAHDEFHAETRGNIYQI